MKKHKSLILQQNCMCIRFPDKIWVREQPDSERTIPFIIDREMTEMVHSFVETYKITTHFSPKGKKLSIVYDARKMLENYIMPLDSPELGSFLNLDYWLVE